MESLKTIWFQRAELKAKEDRVFCESRLFRR